MALPFLDITKSGFSTRSAEVIAARSEFWCARTPFGLAVLRHHEAGQLLRDRRLRQGSYSWPDKVGLAGSFAQFWKRSIISQEGEDHKLLRRIALAALSEDYILSMQADFTRIAESLIDDLRDNSSFDMVKGFSEPFAGRAIALLLGRPQQDAPQIGHDASTLGLAMGMDALEHEDAADAACERLSDLAARLIHKAYETPDPHFVSRLVQAAEPLGLKDLQALIDLVVISIFGGVDTTRAQLGFAAALFAEHSDQWAWLRENSDAVSQAIEEIIRTRPTTTWATREALEDFSFGGVDIARGQTLHIFVHATGTDPLAGSFDGFDVTQRRKTHFGFGGGAHHCLGQFVARTDMACALRVMLDHWEEIRIVGTPEFLPDSGNTSPHRLEIAPTWIDH